MYTMGIIWILLFINITNTCLRVNIVSFILLTTIGMKCHSELYEMKWTKRSRYDNLVPKLANFLISEFEMIGRVECVLRCSMDKPACLGVFYNELQGSCKLLRSNLNQTLVYDIQSGWECLAGNDEAASWDFGWLCSSEHCYLLNQTQQSWIDAKQQCRHLGAHLAEIDSPEENTWITENVLTEIPGDIDPNFWTQCTWIGANDQGTENTFAWSESNTDLTFFNWLSGEPNNFINEDCVAVGKAGTWFDFVCLNRCFSLCQRKLYKR